MMLASLLQHKSPHQALAFKQRLDVVTCAEIRLYRRTNRCCMYFLVWISIWNGKIKLSSEAYRRECELGWSHHRHTIRLVVKADRMSARISRIVPYKHSCPEFQSVEWHLRHYVSQRVVRNTHLSGTYDTLAVSARYAALNTWTF